MQNKHKLWLLGLGLIAVATAALAARPQFLRAPSASLGSPKVIIKWTEIGLGDTASVSYIASATAAARFQCVNRGNNCPAASNKEDVLVDLAVGGTFPIDKNGRISDTLTIPTPESTLVCPGNQRVGVVSVVFTKIQLTDVTHDITAATNPTSLSYNAPECP
ncbi:hypothetical protein LK996_11925 [Lysobacter sp. A6]|uniref:Uncharacterized protein n=1 Tax=Noviluteimonas lactosilytica TaxID=2888523 RepID=A0ABS8JJV8_9GAMM|nr:hypothetical protein [Lysobacter lactosilyticus]MCC8363780.1 hypothetical protein [Lysobacter lactosilyticus]